MVSPFAVCDKHAGRESAALCDGTCTAKVTAWAWPAERDATTRAAEPGWRLISEGA